MGVWGVGERETGAGGAGMTRGGAGSVWEGKREGGADGWAKRRGKEAVFDPFNLDRI